MKTRGRAGVGATIWKYPLEMTASVQTISLPRNSSVLKFDLTQVREPSGGKTEAWLWAMVYPSTGNPDEERHFVIVATGQILVPNSQYLETAFSGPYVWHLFEVPESEMHNHRK